MMLNPKINIISVFPAYLMKDNSGPIKSLLKMLEKLKVPTFNHRIPHEIDLIRAHNKFSSVGHMFPKSRTSKAYEKITSIIKERACHER